jgi:hypothetical protein
VKKETIRKIFDFLEKEENRKKPFIYKLTFNELITKEELVVDGDLNLRDSKIESLPEGLKVGRVLDLANSNIKTLPEGLEVRRSLWLLGCWGLTSLPKGLKVGGSLYIYKTKLEKYSNEELREMIYPGFIKGEIER